MNKQEQLAMPEDRLEQQGSIGGAGVENRLYHTKQDFIRRLSEACDAVGGIEKKGKNEMQGYKYVKAADVAKAFRHELFQRGIVLLQNEMLPEWVEYQTAKGTRGLDCRMAIEYILTDGESEYRLMAYSQAMDTSDKAIYKAKTGALKYFLRGLGIIPDEKDDPEADSPSAELQQAEEWAEEREKLAQQKIAAMNKEKLTKDLKDSIAKSPSPFISEQQGKMLWAIARKLNLGEGDLRDAIKAGCGVDHSKDIRKEDFSKLLAFIDPDFKHHEREPNA